MKNKMLKRSHLSEKTCRDIIQLFSDDLTATQIAGITAVSRVTINNYLKLIRTHIARHCEELRQGFGVAGKQAGRATGSMYPVNDTGADEYNVYYGFYSINENIFTDELTAVNKQSIREFQQSSWLARQEAAHLNGLSRYHAIADFDEWRLYRVDALGVNVKMHQDDGIAVFWGNTRNRLLKFRGMNKNTLYLHVKESEFRYNYREDDINKILLNIIYKYPLHLSKTYV